MSSDHPTTIETFDLVLQGGHVIDPANGISETADVGICGETITRVGQGLPLEQAKQVLDVSGMYVTPGLLDIHTHVYKFRPIEQSYVENIHADAHMFASGVTTAVDTGTAGWEHFLDFKEHTIDQSRVRILAFLNIARSGMVDATSEQRVQDMDPGIAAALAQAFPNLIVGIKTAHYWTRQPWDDEHPAWASVERAVQAGDLCAKPVMVDFWPRPPERSYQDLILKKLRPGDIHTHVFAQQFPIISKAGTVNDFLFEARERGIIFDLGHGAASFWFRNAVPAYRDGFPPDSISTDLHMGNINGPVVSMIHTMNKFLNIGMPLDEVIQRSTVFPARIIGRSELGTLSPGSVADVAVFQKHTGGNSFVDCGGARLNGSARLECMLTLRAGQFVYNPAGLGLPLWEHAPAPYWRTPDLQA